MSGVNQPLGDVIEDLISIQLALHKSKAPSSISLIRRAVVLERLGAASLARQDALRATQIDMSDPIAQAQYCRLAVASQPVGFNGTATVLHDCAVDLLKNPFAGKLERQAALPALDPARLPLVLWLSLPVAERVTLVQRAGDRVEIAGLDQHDLPEALGRAKVNGTAITALDYFVMRRADGGREVSILLKGTAERRSIAACARPQGLPVAAQAKPARLWIVMPVKDGGAALRQCLTSLRAALDQTRGARLILVDDCSELDETRTLLADFARNKRVALHRSATPLGFSAAVNLGLGAIGRGPVLLLNSDTVLTARVLSRLLAHLKADQIGTVTPLSNNAGSLSLLGPGQPCALPSQEICERLAQAAQARNRRLAIDIPTGNGFCMLISDACLQATGRLSGHYESGYYEEVDFCLRATAKGFRHVAAVDCFVGHHGSVSYGAARHRLIAANRRRLHQRFPGYAACYDRFAAFDPLKVARQRLYADLAPAWVPEALETVWPAVAQDPQTMTLPQIAGGPVVIPFAEADLPATLRKMQFLRLRLVPEASLSAAGLRLCPPHLLRAAIRDTDMVIWSGNTEDDPAPSFTLACAEPDARVIASFEAAVLALLPNPSPQRAANVLPV